LAYDSQNTEQIETQVLHPMSFVYSSAKYGLRTRLTQ